jgi:glyoxylase-like metal-dependent hydrolase (beta-lactamase superfamily II)/rhodanese-related sulfurtransferase
MLEPQTNTELKIPELLSMIDSGEALLLLDVRNDDEHRSWPLEGRRPVKTIHIPYFEFIEAAEASLAQVPAHPGPIAVLCAKGGSSELVAALLRETGRAARNVAGGMAAYGEFLLPVRVPLDKADIAGLEIWQINRRGKGCLSYLVRAGEEAVVIDPSRQVDFYQAFARGLGARIVRVLDTHIHADHVSGGAALARRTGASYFVPAVAPRLDPKGLPDAAALRAEVVATPGHTPESVCYLIAGRYLFTGDTLFSDGIGRPDLGNQLQQWGRELYRSIHERLHGYSDQTLVLPAHYAGPAAINPDGTVTGRLRTLRQSVPELQLVGEDEFIQALTSQMRPAPRHYEDIVKVNLGTAEASEEQVCEWELGRNQCAVGRVAA